MSIAQAATINKIAAVVNGDMISYYDVQQAALPDIKKLKLSTKNSAHKEQIEKIYKETLDNMILEILIINEAEKHKVEVTDSEVDAEISRIMQQSNLSKEGFEKRLLAEGLTPATLRSRIHSTITRQKLMGMMVGRKVVVSPEEVQAYYDTNKSELKQSPDPVLALLIYPDSSNVEQHAATIAQDTSKFEQIASEISIGPNRANGGVLGHVPSSKLDPNLVKLISTLSEGGVTPVINLGGKKAQFKLVKAASDGGVMSFEEAKPVIENILREPKLKERFDEYITQLRKKAIIDIRM